MRKTEGGNNVKQPHVYSGISHDPPTCMSILFLFENVDAQANRTDKCTVAIKANKVWLIVKCGGITNNKQMKRLYMYMYMKVLTEVLYGRD